MITRTLRVSALALAIGFGTGTAEAEVSPLDLVEPIAEYKIYVAGELDQLVAGTKAFTDAVKAGDLELAKSLYAPSRVSYERIEPVAELFSDLDVSIDARADDYELGEDDPAFTGFHRLEYGLFAHNSTAGLAEFADRLMADVTELNSRILDLAVPPEKVVGGAAVLMEEVAASKISGEEDRYSHTDLWDFDGNLTGALKIYELVRPLIETDEAAFVGEVDGNFQKVRSTLDKYRTDKGFALYDVLSEADRAVLATAVNALAEDLSTLRAKLGLS